MENAIRGNERKRASQIYREDDRTTIQRRQTNGVVIDQPRFEDDDELLHLSLTLGPTIYPSQISPPMTSPQLRVAPPPSPFSPPMTLWPSPDDLLTRYFMTPSPSPYQTSSSLRNSLHQMRSTDPPIDFFAQSAFAPPPSNQTRARSVTSAAESRHSTRSNSVRKQKSDMISPPYPWATNKRGQIHSLEYLESNQITTITGDVQCKNCEKVYQVSYNLREKFSEIGRLFLKSKRIMRERALPRWTDPEPKTCELCGREKSVKPVIAERKCNINWLFLLLGQTLGYCTLEQLKNFCKHLNSHRTGAKERVLYSTYLGLCRMLDPNREIFQR